MKLKCKISDLQTLCQLTSLKGKSIEGKECRALLDCLIDVSNKKLTVKAMDIQGTFALKFEYFNIEILEDGPLPIGDLEKFESFLSRFNSSDEITLSTFENKIVIERVLPHKIARIPLADVQSLNSKEAPILDKLKYTESGFPQTDKTHFNLSMIINAEEIKSIFDDGNVVKQRVLPWTISDEKLHVSIGSQEYGEFESEIGITDISNDATKPCPHKTKTTFGTGLDNIFSNLSGKVKIYLPDESELSPLIVEQQCDNYRFFAILAPLVVPQ